MINTMHTVTSIQPTSRSSQAAVSLSLAVTQASEVATIQATSRQPTSRPSEAATRQPASRLLAAAIQPRVSSRPPQVIAARSHRVGFHQGEVPRALQPRVEFPQRLVLGARLQNGINSANDDEQHVRNLRYNNFFEVISI